MNRLARRRGRRATCALCAWLCVAALHARCDRSAASAAAPEFPPTPIGIEGSRVLFHDGPPLEARPADERSAIVVRIAEFVPMGDSMGYYQLRYIANRPGKYNLADSLVAASQRPITLAPILVQVSSRLPADHDGSLAEGALPDRGFVWPYALSLRIGLGVWLAVTVFLVGRRIARAAKREIVDAQIAPTLADQLRPLVEAAIAGRATAAEQARLEAMLLGHWRRASGLDHADAAVAMRKLRSDPSAGALVTALEDWLHAPPSGSRFDVEALLAPYRAAPPLAEECLHLVEGVA